MSFPWFQRCFRVSSRVFKGRFSFRFLFRVSLAFHSGLLQAFTKGFFRVSFSASLGCHLKFFKVSLKVSLGFNLRFL